MNTVTNLNRYQRRKEKTREDLLLAARGVLAKKGYHNTKITDIAAAADIGVGTFYLYFPTKDALFLELVQETAQALKAAIEEARSQVEGSVEKIHAVNLAFFRFAQENRELFTIIFGHGNTFDELLRRVYAMFVADATQRVADGISQEVFRLLPPEVIANAIVGMSAQVVSWWIEQDQRSAEEVAEVMTNFILHGLVRA